MKKIILELDPETNQATWIVKRGNRRTRYNPTASSVKRLDGIFDYLGLDYAMNYSGKFYMASNAVERIEPELVLELATEYPDDER